MVHETRKVGQVAPKRIHFLNWFVDFHFLIDPDSEFVRNARARTGSLAVPTLRRVDTQGLVHRAVAGRAAPQQTSTKRRQTESGIIPPRQAISNQRTAADQRNPTLSFTDVCILSFCL